MNFFSGACCRRSSALFGSSSGSPDVCVNRWRTCAVFLALAGKLGNVARDPVAEIELAALDQEHRRHVDHRLGDRGHVEHGIAADRLGVGLRPLPAEEAGSHRLAGAADQDRPARHRGVRPGRPFLHQVVGDLQPLGVDADVLGLDLGQARLACRCFVRPCERAGRKYAPAGGDRRPQQCAAREFDSLIHRSGPLSPQRPVSVPFPPYNQAVAFLLPAILWTATFSEGCPRLTPR